MIKVGLKNFVSNLKYVLVILGAMFIGLLFGVYGFLSAASRSFNKISADISALAEEVSASSDDVRQAFIDAYLELDFSDPETVVNDIVSEEFWENNVISKLKDRIENIEPYINQISDDIADAVSELLIKIVFTGIYLIVGMFAGYLISHYLIHKENTKSKFFKALGGTILDSVTSVGLFTLAIILLNVWPKGGILIIIVFLLLFNFIALSEAYLMQGRGKIKYKEAYNFKNVAFFFLSNLIVFLISAAIIALLFTLTNILVAFFIAVPLLLVAIITNLSTAESYIVNIVGKKNNINEQKSSSKEQKSIKNAEIKKETKNA